MVLILVHVQEQLNKLDITVVPSSTLVYAGADPSTPNQTVCSGTPLTDIEFRIGGGARDVNVSGRFIYPAQEALLEQIMLC